MILESNFFRWTREISNHSIDKIDIFDKLNLSADERLAV